MANIKKNFNFRNGVQVDDDNLLVTATGLVGIGTTIPVEALDVRGNVVITGFTSATTQKVGFLTVTTLEPEKIIGAGISIVSGIVTGQGTGLVTYFGDASNLLGMPTSQWEDVDVGLGFTSIYNTGGNVGVATEDPRSTIQAGGNVDAGERGVGISSAGNINATGIITAASFVGDLTGNIVSASTFSGNIDLNADLDVDGHTNLDNVSVAGVTTFSGNVDIDAHTFLDNVSISGVTTTTGNVDINADVDVDGHTNLDNVSIAGVTTFASLIDGNGGATIDNLQIGVTDNNEIDTSTGNITIDSAGGTTIIDDILNVSGTSIFNDDIGVVGLTTTKDLLVTGITTLTGDLDVGFVKASSRVFATKLGVGTTEIPVNDIQVRKSGDVEVQITSETGTAGLTIGRETGNADTNNSEIRYGKVTSGAPYSSAQSLDILNYGTGNFNYHLSANNAGSVDGDFHWHKGINNSRLMTLTGIGGSLGIGITNPSTTLHVIGQATVSGNVILGGDLDVSGNAALNVIGQVTGDLTGNVNATTGVSTFKRLDLDTTSYYEFGELSAAGVGIGTTMGNFKLVVNDDADKKFFITDSGNVGVKTDSIGGNALFVSGDIVSLEALGVGTTLATSVVDFSNAGQNLTGIKANKMFMIPPKVTNTQRGNLTGLVSGAMIYNTNLNKLQVYNGSAWETVSSSV